MESIDSQAYQRKKAQLAGVLTVYGRNPVLEALRDTSLRAEKLHLAASNRDAPVIRELLGLAEQRNVPVSYHSREALARISRNGKQDQGVALDVRCPHFQTAEGFLAQRDRLQPHWVLAIDGIHNPANLGMLIRSAVAAGIDGLLLGQRGVASLGPLVIKASAGTLFRAPILRCGELHESLLSFREQGFTIHTLAADAQQSLFAVSPERAAVFVLGNETDGVSSAVQAVSNVPLRIPMANAVESLNVAVTGALVAYQRRR
jgi:23S rRNA (guanosine2251-2'-O)-methyltransferase